MIDMHTHILPGVDDGSSSICDSIEMLRKAETLGFEAVVLTPHYMSYTDYTSTLQTNKKIMNQLISEISEQGIRIKLYLGNEIFFDPEILDIFESDQFIALNKSTYYLVETVRHDANVAHFEDFLYRLQLKGFYPIIAHPERYDFVQNDPKTLLDFIEKGSLVQMNALSLVGYYGHHAQDTAKILLERNMVQFMASDAHSLRAYEKMDEALDIAWELLGEDRFNRIMKINPRIAVGGKGQIQVNPEKVTKNMKKKSFLTHLFDKAK
jgi:protein-tyrosine phosphatase